MAAPSKTSSICAIQTHDDRLAAHGLAKRGHIEATMAVGLVQLERQVGAPLVDRAIKTVDMEHGSDARIERCAFSHRRSLSGSG